jgi:hypothetical protein
VDQSWAGLYKSYQRFVLRVRTQVLPGNTMSYGTGWILAASGHGIVIATCLHVIQPALDCDGDIDIFYFDGQLVCKLNQKNCRAALMPDADLAILSVPLGPGETSPFPESPPLLIHSLDEIKRTGMHPKAETGTDVGWIGYPSGIYESLKDARPTICVGRVSAFGIMSTSSDGQHIYTYIIDGNVLPGMSGGPAFTSTGVVIGSVRTFFERKAGETPAPAHGFGLVIPIGCYVSAFSDVGDRIGLDVQDLKAMQAPESPCFEANPQLLKDIIRRAD